jgi:hypothetical protein
MKYCIVHTECGFVHYVGVHISLFRFFIQVSCRYFFRPHCFSFVTAINKLELKQTNEQIRKIYEQCEIVSFLCGSCAFFRLLSCYTA